MIYKTHLCLTWALIGAVWFVLRVHYPFFRLVPKEDFGEFEQFHIQRTNRLVIPVMVLEAATGLVLVTHGPIFILNAFLIGLIWIFTFAGCLPMHKQLKNGFSEPTYKKLLFVHSIRTGLWTLRGLILFLIKFPS